MKQKINSYLTKYNISLEEFERYIEDMANAMSLPITYNIEQNNDKYIILADKVNSLHAYFLSFYIMNKSESGKKLRQELDELINLIKTIQKDVLLVEVARQEHGFVTNEGK